jgi:hypothetical protein
MSASESRSDVVLALAEEFLERYRQGQRPSLKEYIDRHPDLAAEIKEVFPAMALMENVALADESLAGDATGPTTPMDSAPPQQLGDYRMPGRHLRPSTPDLGPLPTSSILSGESKRERVEPPCRRLSSDSLLPCLRQACRVAFLTDAPSPHRRLRP